MLKKYGKRVLSMFMAVLMIIATLPMSQVTAYATPASDIPEEMIDNVYLDALAYTGYDVQAQKNDGTIFITYGSSAPASVRSNISYGTGPSGLETVGGSTVTGLAPDIAKYESNGLCCASYVSYVYYNYMTNVAGIDTSKTPCPSNPRSAYAYNEAADSWVASGVARRITFSQNADGSNFVASEEIPIGSLIVFKSIEEGSIAHVAVYAGTYNGKHFVTHVGNDRGPEISTIENMSKGGYPEAVAQIVTPDFVEEYGYIEVYKKDNNGKALAGAIFEVTSVDDSSLKFYIGPTNSSGYAKSIEPVPYGEYTIKETVFPTNYRSYGQTEWRVTVSDANNGVATFNVVNELIPGNCQIVKTSEDGVVDGIKFTITGNGVNKTVTTANGGKVTITDLKPGIYTVTETVADRYEPQETRSVTVVSGQTATVTFNNILKRGSLKVTKTSEDGLVEGVQFKLSGTSLSGHKVEQYAVTNSKGIAVFSDVLISGTTAYTIEEVNTASKYVVPAKQTATIEWNKVTNKSFYNELKRGDLKITKTSEDGLVEGMKFHLYGTSLSGQYVDLYATTNEKGIAEFNDVLIGTNFVIEEVNTAERYITPSSQTVAIEWNKVTNKSFYNELKRGDLRVVKTSEDGVIKGMKFHLYGTSLSGIYVDEYATTNAEGIAEFKDILIGTNFIIEEVDTPYRYIVPSKQRAVIEWDKVTGKSFCNELKRGDLKITKTSEDRLTEGMKFHLYGTSVSGIYVDEYATTNADGVAVFDDILIGTGYVIEEVETQIRYVVPDSQNVDINWKEVTEGGFENILKKFKVIVTKSDIEEGMPQGDAKLSGAKYGIYKGNQLVDIYETDENGQFTTKYYICGDDWEIREIEPSEGYLLDTTSYHIGAEAKLYEVELNSTEVEVYETVQKGTIAIIKHTDDGETKIETPESGAEFMVYLKASGSFEDAKETERDYLVCDENGFAVTKDLPYGVYTVVQTKGWDGRELLPAFDVYIAKDGEVYRYLINNANFESYIKVVKTDEETGKTIPCAGVGFNLFRPDGSKVEMTYTYPTVTTIDTFYTNADGYLVTPEKLEYGTGYSLVEVSAPYGYVLNDEPVYFDVTAENATEENGIVVVTVERPNMAQKGKIIVTKTGEMFSSVTVIGGGVMEDGEDKTFPNIYQPVYEIGYLEGTVFEVTAAEDIITPDGTLRAVKGEVVATITTGKDGIAATDLLYLGKYEVKEVEASYGMVLNTEIQTVELLYAGQEVKVTKTDISYLNDRQKATISLNKMLEQDELFGIGLNDEILNVSFGLYAGEDIIALDRTMIPKDGLIEIAYCNEYGNVTFKSDIPVGAKLYVKEYSIDEHYMISEECYPVTFDYVGQSTAVVTIDVNDGEAIANDMIRGTIVGKKLDEDGFTVAGAMFGLFKEDEVNFSEENAIMIATSNEIGIFGFENVPYGKWIVRELQPAKAFVLNETEYEVEVSENEQMIEIEVVNEFIEGTVTVVKVDAENPDVKLSGVVFEVYVDVDGDSEFDADIDILVGEMTENEAGVYVMEKLRYNGYFLHEKSGKEGYFVDDGYYYFEITMDGQKVTVENETGIGFANKPITGELVITKTDVSDGELLPNAGFRIRNEQGEIVVEGYTDGFGIAKFTLRYGKYTYEEFDAPNGYLIDSTPYEFEIKENGQIVKADMTNRKEPVIDVPQTGDSSKTGFFIGLAAIAIGGIIASVIMIKKKDEDDE